MQIERMVQELEFGESAGPFRALRSEVEGLFEDGEPDRARLRLEVCLEHDDDLRTAEENAWLYRRLGDAYLTQEQIDDAIGAYRRALEFDPRDENAALELSALLAQRQQFGDGLDVVRLVLLNHGRKMADGDIATLYVRTGQFYEGLDELEQARQAFEKALVKAPEDKQALTGLLRVVAAVGEPGDVVEARLKLIRGLDEAQARSMALVGLGDDWIEQFNDPGRALDTYEEAMTEWPENERAISRIADVAADMGDWRRVSRAYFTLHVLSDDSQQKAEYLIESSDVARKQLWEPEKALAGYRNALEWDPTRLDAFTAITSILVDARDWESLEEAYVQIITANAERDDADARLLGVLWEKLAELYSDHLERVDDAIFAYQQAIEHQPERTDLRRSLVDLAEEREAHYEVAAQQLRILMEAQPGEPQWVDRLGRVCLRREQVDRAYCMFRALRAGGHSLDAKPAQFLERFDRGMAPTVDGQINPSMLKRFIFSQDMSSTLNNCYSLLKQGLKKWVGESRRKQGLGWRDDVDMSKPLAFVNFYKKIGAALGYLDLPTLWRKEDQRGLVNGALAKGGLIVGDELLGSGEERYIAFSVAKQLFLYLDPFYLATIRSRSDLKAFFLLALALVRPETGLSDQFQREKTYKKAYKSLRKGVKGDDRRELERCVQELTRDGDDVDIGPWLESIEDSANRIGLLFSDSLQVARECLEDERDSISNRSVDARFQKLVDYSVSERFLSLRSQLGIEVA